MVINTVLGIQTKRLPQAHFAGRANFQEKARIESIARTGLLWNEENPKVFYTVANTATPPSPGENGFTGLKPAAFDYLAIHANVWRYGRVDAFFLQEGVPDGKFPKQIMAAKRAELSAMARGKYSVDFRALTDASHRLLRARFTRLISLKDVSEVFFNPKFQPKLSAGLLFA